ncbi:MAG: tetratricopeptide repeat protein, partial [Actinomycetota bacterium]
YGDAQRSLEEAWPVARELATSHLTAVALTCLGRLARARGYFSRDRELMVEAVTLHHQAGLRPFLPYCLNVLGQALLSDGNPVAARPLFQESLSLSRASGRKRNEALALLGLGEISVLLRGAEVGRPILDEALTVARESGNNLAIGRCLHALGRLARRASSRTHGPCITRRCVSRSTPG